MAQLDLLKLLLDTPDIDDLVLEFCLDTASDLICDIRNSDTIEAKYLNIQIKIAVEIFNKLGAEGEISHSENGMARSYESADVSPSLLSMITPFAKSPYSTTRVIT